MKNQTRRIMRELYKRLERDVKIIVLDITAGLIEETPVDTGWARANWIPNIGSPFQGPVGSHDDFDTTQQEQGQAQVATKYKLEDGPVFITNHVPYVPDLNEGSSPQAPAGFIDEIIDRVVEAANARRVSR